MLSLDGRLPKRPVTGEELSAAAESGSEIEIKACVHKVRAMSGFSFVLLRTGRYVFQSVYDPSRCADSLDGIREGVYVSARGTVRKDERAPHGAEIELTGITAVSVPAAEYPLHVSARRLGCSLEANLAARTVALRNPAERAVFKIAEGVVSGFRGFMLDEGFTEIHSPKIVSVGAEGGANIFKLKYFGRDVFLTQSPQFYKQTCVAFFDRVFEIAPVYRAERHNTVRHLNEYIGLDFEMGFIDDMYDVMAMETAMLRHVMKVLEKDYSHELSLLGAKLPQIDSIPSVTFLEAMEILGRRGRFDLDPEDEVKLCDWALKTHGSEFVFVTHYPAAKRPFYAMDDKDDSRLALSFDLLFRGLEITTGGQRIHSYEEQVAKMQRLGMDIQDFEPYLEAHKYGLPPHGGLGIGLERLVMKLLGLQNIRGASLFPRDITHVTP